MTRLLLAHEKGGLIDAERFELADRSTAPGAHQTVVPRFQIGARSDLIDAASRGEDIIVTRNGWPVARLQPYHQSRPPAAALLGALKGRIALHEPSDTGEETEAGDARHAGA